MTIYGSTKKLNSYHIRSRKYRKENDERYSPSGQCRVVKAYAEQWKRYPHSRNTIALRMGHKTNTLIFSEGYDPTFEDTLMYMYYD
jgi:hypothetical protein